MQTDLLFTNQTRINRARSGSWVYALVFSYMLQLVFELSMIQFTQGADGRWVVSTIETPHLWKSLLLVGNAVLGLIGTLGFVITFIRDKRAGRWNPPYIAKEVSGRDVLYTLAWIQVFQTGLLLLYGVFVDFPLFTEGSIPGLLESASFQISMLIIGFFWFRGRGDSIGFALPPRPWRMFVAVIGLFIIMGLALDTVITTPVADWLHLSLDSEREANIQNEIDHANQNHWLNGLFSMLMVGIIVPIGEEILFRGVIQTFLIRRWGAVAGILMSSFWFAFIHIDIALFAPLFVIGLGLGLVRYKFQTIWASIILHCLNNLMSVIVSTYAFLNM